MAPGEVRDGPPVPLDDARHELGDDRARFPTPMVLQAIAGTCPITERSGRFKIIKFRRACDRDLRFIAQQWARKAIAQSDWVETYFRTLLSRNLSRFQAEGMIKIDGRNVLVTDLKALESELESAG